MGNDLFDANIILNTFTQVDTAAATTANNVSNAFLTSANNAQLSFMLFKDAMVAGLLELDAAILNTQVMGDAAYAVLFGNAQVYVDAFKNAFLTATAEMDTSIQNTQIFGDASFALLFANALTYCTTYKDGLLVCLDETAVKCSEIAVGIESNLCLAFENTKNSVLESISMLNAEVSVKFEELQTSGESAALSIKNNFNEQFSEIEANFALTTDNVIGGLKTLTENFGIKTDEINQKTESIGTAAENTGSSFWDITDKTTTIIGGLTDTIGGISDGIELWNKLKEKNVEIGKNELEIEDSIINMLFVNTGAQATNTAATATAGTTASSAALGMLAFGTGILLAAMALALLAKTIFNVLKMFGMEFHGVTASDFDLGFNIPGLATGGYPSTGQMFIAREAGPELVGTIGSRSVVVNNEQIVESVSRGVYDAVRAAMAGRSSQSGSPLEVKLYLDGKQITNAVEKVQKERGLTLSNRSLAMA